MNFVDPIRDKTDIHKMYVYLQSQSMRDYLLFKFAIHTGIKLNELLNLKVEDVLNPQHEVVHVWVTSTSQDIRVIIPEKLRGELIGYIREGRLTDTSLLFQSKRTKKGLSRQQAYRIINAAATKVGIEHIGLTTLRKTFAYHTYRSGVSISIIQKYLGHQTSYETMKFIGITKKEINTTIALNL